MYAVADGASIQIRFAARLLHPAAQLDLASVSSALGCFFGFGRPGCGMAYYFVRLCMRFGKANEIVWIVAVLRFPQKQNTRPESRAFGSLFVCVAFSILCRRNVRFVWQEGPK